MVNIVSSTLTTPTKKNKGFLKSQNLFINFIKIKNMNLIQQQDPFNFKQIMSSHDYYNKREQLRREINSRKLEKISGENWKKDINEKMKTFNLAEANRTERKSYFGEGNYKKYLNTPNNSLSNKIVLTF